MNEKESERVKERERDRERGGEREREKDYSRVNWFTRLSVPLADVVLTSW